MGDGSEHASQAGLRCLADSNRTSSPSRRVAGSEPLYAEARALVAAAPNDIFLVRIQGAMAAEMSVFYGDRQELVQVWEKHKYIKDMGNKLPDNRPLANARAQLATVLYPHLCAGKTA